MDKRRNNTNDNWSSKAQFYLQGMSMENSLLQSYRMIFGAMEAILLFTWFEVAIPELGKLLIFIMGVIVCILWIVVCICRAVDVKAWREKVKEVVRQTEAETFILERWEIQTKARFFLHVTSARLWLNLFLPLLLILVWSFLLGSCGWITLGVFLFLFVLFIILRIVFKVDVLQV